MKINYLKGVFAIFFILGIIVLYVHIRDTKIEKEINENKFTTVGIIIEFKKQSRKTSNDIIYGFHFNGKSYNGRQSCKDLIFETGKFYKVDISTINPEHSRIHLDKEITDLTEIKKAGF